MLGIDCISTRSRGIIRKIRQRALEEREQQGYRLGRHETFDIEWSVKYLDRIKVLGFEYKWWEMVLVPWATEPGRISISNLCFQVLATILSEKPIIINKSIINNSKSIIINP